VEEGAAAELGQLPGHAGAFETSLVMALRPELVDKAAYPAALGKPPFPPDARQRPTVIRAGSSLGSGPGYTDDPSRASAEAGSRMLDLIVREVAAFLVELGRG